MALPARRGRRARRHEHHRVGHRHPAGEHADRRARRPLRPRPALPDPRARRAAAASAPTRTCCIPSAAALTEEATKRLSARSATTPSSAPASRSRCATSRSAAPATCSATSSPATSPRSASSSTCDARRGRARGRPATAATTSAEPVRLDVNVDAYVPADYIPYEQAKIDVHRRIAGAREVADLGELRDELEDRFGPVPEPLREPARAPAGADQARPGRRARGDVPQGAPGGHARSSSTPRRARSACARSCPRRATSRAARRSRCACPTTPRSGFPAVVARRRRRCWRPSRAAA